MTKILAFDPGTNSLGMVCRDTMRDNLMDQITSGVDIIRDNTECDRRGRHSSAASQRRSFRNTRTRYRSVKRRKQATLKLLIKHNCCPLDEESLNKWRFDDDKKGYDRIFPVHNSEFMNWINFEFVIDNEVVRSIYRLREILATKVLDFSKRESWYMLGRAIYSIAVRRGFKSSRNATSSIDSDDDEQIELQESEETLSTGLKQYMEQYQCPTVGAAFARMEKVDKIRIRANSDYKPIRSMLKDEIRVIFKVQNLDVDGELYKGLMSEKKHEGTIFYKNPLKSQKGKVEFCTLEPHKRRCPKSHPANEFNVAWQLLNNIKINVNGSWQNPSVDVRRKIYDKLFVRNKKHFDFVEIREMLQEEYNQKFEYKESINYNDMKSVAGCPVTYYLQKILGSSWEQERIQGTNKHLTHAQRRKNCFVENDKKLSVENDGHTTEYSAEDIWHICFESDEKQFVKDFAKNSLGFASSKVASMGALWEAIQDGYSSLSLCAIRKINSLLAKGYVYSDAVILAKLPDIMGKAVFCQNEQEIMDIMENEKQSIAEINRRYDIANKLISEYKSLKMEDQAFAERDYDYTLDKDDIKDVRNACTENYGNEWNELSDEQRSGVISDVADLYQTFFFSKQRDYFRRLNFSDSFKSALLDRYSFLSEKKLNRLYHHSNNAYYPVARPNEQGVLQLGSPAKAGLCNPTVLKVLSKIKQNVNKLLKNGSIDTDTIIVIENAREELCDFNKRWAIEEYDNKRNAENKAIEKALDELEHEQNLQFPRERVSIARLALYQNENFTPYNESKGFYEKMCEKYKLWLSQGFIDFYTGRLITLSELFSEYNLVEIDHILPISKSFDDSISNKVLCSSRYNSNIKGTKFPCELPNYLKDTEEGSAIINRIREIGNKVRFLEGKVLYWKKRSSLAADPDSKNYAIKQKHLWQMEFDEWNKRLVNLTTKEITPSFRNNQLNDTRTISKYAYHYLKSVFGRVVVQRGQTTAVFRKIFGFQDVYENKDRSLHTHHAIDALTLSLIPYGAKREQMMELWYRIEEARRFGNATQELELRNKLDKEKKQCGLGHYSPNDVVRYIEQTTLVKTDSTNYCLKRNIKRYRVRGKVVPLRDKDGNVVYETTPNGMRVKAKYVSQGNSIRGAIHKQTFYGKIVKWKDEDNSKDKRKHDDCKKKEFEEKFVLRKKIEFKSGEHGDGFKSWEDLEEKMVDKKLFKKFKKQFPDGTSFKQACAEGFYTYVVEDGIRRKVKVRHVRCYDQSARPLKKHIFQSLHDNTEKYYYVSPGDAYGVFEYKSKDGVYEYRSENLFTLSEKMKDGSLTETPCPKRIINKKGKECFHTRTILTNDTILIYPSTESAESQYQLDTAIVSNRLYRVNTIDKTQKSLTLTRHNIVKSWTGKNTISDSDFVNLPDGMRMRMSKLHFLLLGTDFDIVDGKIVSLKHD